MSRRATRGVGWRLDMFGHVREALSDTTRVNEHRRAAAGVPDLTLGNIAGVGLTVLRMRRLDDRAEWTLRIPERPMP